MPRISHSKDHVFVNGDSAKAASLAPDFVNQVALIVTSPPYHNAISYGSHADNPDADYRARDVSDYEKDYLTFLKKVWDSSWGMLRPGGILAVNVGSVLEDGHHYALPLDISSQLENSNLNWKFVKTIIWHKVTAGVKRAGSVIQHPFPGYWHPNIMTEHILIFQKPGARINLNKNLPGEWYDGIWDIAPVPPRTIEHPAPFPEDIPHRLISLFTKPGEVVFDPFSGAGTTTKAAVDLGRRSLGFDLESNYIDYAIARMPKPSGVRKFQLSIVPVDFKDFESRKVLKSVRQGTGKGSRKRIDV